MTQERLSTGNKVNSAIDNPSSYYTARSLTNRASDLDALLDSMGQAVQTIKAANEGIEAGLNLLEQLQAVGNQALENPVKTLGGGSSGKSVEELEAEGFRVVSTAADLQSAISAGAKIALGGDITLDTSLNITAANVVLDGNGHKLTYNASSAGEAAISVDGTGASADIKNLNIEVSGEQVYGIAAKNGASVTLDNTEGIKVNGTGSQKIWFRDEALYDGKGNTQAMLDQIGADALAATAANQFYVGDKNGDFGQSNWYLPSIGEWMDVYGIDPSAMISGTGISGATGANKTIINNALATLADKGAEAATLTNGYYWSSSECSNYFWGLDVNNGNRIHNPGSLSIYIYVRSFQTVENCFDASGSSPKIGDVMYTDKTWGSAEDYDGSKTAAGIVTAVGNDGSVKIMNLKDLTFSSNSTVGNFDADNPYGGSVKYTYHTTSAKYSEDVTDIPNYDTSALLNAVKTGGTITVTFTPYSAGGGSGSNSVNSAYAAQYNEILNQYDMLINDASYKGINLLKADTLDVNFNEYRTTGYSIAGKDISSANIGLQEANWTSFDDVEVSIEQVRSAILTLRSYSGELGNNYSIVQNRQDFTQNLINILTEGADKLTLADMNEESANMLALQTRQQLAVNSLSLASQASQAILKLF